MYNLYCVVFGLNMESEYYDRLVQELKSSPDWIHYIKSTWIIRTEESANELYERLRPGLHNDDMILVTEIGDQVQGRMPNKTGRWFRQYLSLNT